MLQLSAYESSKPTSPNPLDEKFEMQPTDADELAQHDLGRHEYIDELPECQMTEKTEADSEPDAQECSVAKV